MQCETKSYVPLTNAMSLFEFTYTMFHYNEIQVNSTDMLEQVHLSCIISQVKTCFWSFLQISVSQQAILEPKSMGGQFQAKRPQMFASNST